MRNARCMRRTPSGRIFVGCLMACAGLSMTTRSGLANTSRPTASSSLQINSTARELLEKTVHIYRGFKSFSCSIKETVKSGGKTQNHLSRFVYQKPCRYSLRGDDGLCWVNDGTYSYFYYPQHKGYYSKVPMPGPEYGEARIMQYPPLGALLTPIFSGLDPFQAPWGKLPLELLLEKPKMIDNALVDIVAVRDVAGQIPTRFFFAISRKDHLVRRVTYQEHSTHGVFELTQDISNVKLNAALPATTFIFTPPAGAKEETLENNSYPPQYGPNVKVGEAAPPFQARDVNGEEISLDKYTGRVVLLDFWATWCGPCLEEISYVQDIYRKYHAKGLEIVGISCDFKRTDLEAFLKVNAMPWTHIQDGKGFSNTVSRIYGLHGIPLAIVIGRDGKIVSAGNRSLLLEDDIRKALTAK